MAKLLTNYLTYKPLPESSWAIPEHFDTDNNLYSLGGVELEPHDLKNLAYKLDSGYEPKYPTVRAEPKNYHYAYAPFLVCILVGTVIGLVMLGTTLAFQSDPVKWFIDLIFFVAIVGFSGFLGMLGSVYLRRYYRPYYFDLIQEPITDRTLVDVRERTIKLAEKFGHEPDFDVIFRQTSFASRNKNPQMVSSCVSSFQSMYSTFQPIVRSM